jgi:putative transposase
MSVYETYEDVLSSIPYFIEEVYNRKRLNSSLDYMGPEEFEYKFNKNKSHQLVLI